MAKAKPVKSESEGGVLKRKKLSSNDSEVHVEAVMDVKVKRKKGKKTEVEEEEEGAEIESPQVEIQADKKQKKDKKGKKKQKAEEMKEVEVAEDEEAVVEGEEDLSPEERRVMERKMKKILKKEEKKKLKEEGKTAEKAEPSAPMAPQQALDYLTCWAENRGEWKFQKLRQTWLLQHMFHSEKVPDDKFSVLLQYLEGLRGGARDTTVKKALVLVEESGQAPEDRDVQQRAHRAKEVIQLLS
ncbi:cholesin-like [Genypterus blacodes]|uniref:cholesin-like n=1 Tax=Genypterus blacodes TaxID=154954 RepID=UPI003F767786